MQGNDNYRRHRAKFKKCDFLIFAIRPDVIENIV